MSTSARVLDLIAPPWLPSKQEVWGNHKLLQSLQIRHQFLQVLLCCLPLFLKGHAQFASSQKSHVVLLGVCCVNACVKVPVVISDRWKVEARVLDTVEQTTLELPDCIKIHLSFLLVSEPGLFIFEFWTKVHGTRPLAL